MDFTPVTVNCSGACTVTHLVTVDVPPFNLSLEDGAQIAGAILAVWAVAWAFRTLIRMVRDSDGNNQPEED